jgi:hypothetical protein
MDIQKSSHRPFKVPLDAANSVVRFRAHHALGVDRLFTNDLSSARSTM